MGMALAPPPRRWCPPSRACRAVTCVSAIAAVVCSLIAIWAVHEATEWTRDRAIVEGGLAATSQMTRLDMFSSTRLLLLKMFANAMAGRGSSIPPLTDSLWATISQNAVSHMGSTGASSMTELAVFPEVTQLQKGSFEQGWSTALGTNVTISSNYTRPAGSTVNYYPLTYQWPLTGVSFATKFHDAMSPQWLAAINLTMSTGRGAVVLGPQMSVTPTMSMMSNSALMPLALLFQSYPCGDAVPKEGFVVMSVTLDQLKWAVGSTHADYEYLIIKSSTGQEMFTTPNAAAKRQLGGEQVTIKEQHLTMFTQQVTAGVYARDDDLVASSGTLLQIVTLAGTVATIVLTALVAVGAAYLIGFKRYNTLKVAQRSLDKTIAYFCHESRQPLQLMIGELAEVEHASSCAVALQQLMRVVSQGTSEITRIVEDVVMWRAESGDLTVTLAAVDLEKWRGHLLARVRSQLPAQFPARIRASGTMPAGLTIDRVRVQQILLNAITNAVRATPDRSSDLEPLIDVSLQYCGGCLVAMVMNRGGGVKGPLPRGFMIPTPSTTSPKVLVQTQRMAHVTQPPELAYAQSQLAYREHSVSHSKVIWNFGVGLGLPLSKKLAHMMHGDVGLVDHHATTGWTVFWLVVPADLADMSLLSVPSTPMMAMPPHASGHGSSGSSWAASSKVHIRGVNSSMTVGTAATPQHGSSKLTTPPHGTPHSAQSGNSVRSSVNTLRSVDTGNTADFLAPVRSISPKEDMLDGYGIVIDDQVGIRKLACKGLTRAGLRAEQLADGSQLLGFLDQQLTQPKLILMDNQMEDCLGIEVVAELREWEQARGYEPVPVYAMTGDTDAESQARFLQAGFTGLCKKPFSREDLLQLVLCHS